MIVVFDIRELLNEIRIHYTYLIKTEKINLHYDELDFIEFSLWTIKRNFNEEHYVVQDLYNTDNFEYISCLILKDLLHGMKCSMYDLVHEYLKSLNINFVHDQRYIYSFMIVQNSLVIGRTNKSYYTEGRE